MQMHCWRVTTKKFRQNIGEKFMCLGGGAPHSDLRRHFLFLRSANAAHVLLAPVSLLVYPVCPSVCNATTFNSLHLERSFLVCRYVFGTSRSGSYIKFKEQRSLSVYPVCGLSVFDWKAILLLLLLMTKTVVECLRKRNCYRLIADF